MIKYLFFRLHSISLSNGEQSPIYAFVFVFLLFLVNLYSIVDCILLTIGVGFPALPKYFVLGYTLGVFYFLYFILWKDGKDKMIVAYFKEEDKDKRWIKTLMIVLYFIVTIILFIYLGIKMRELR
ncbi:MAG: hypothetical protein WCJ61_09680 [Paludibacter sp.]